MKKATATHDIILAAMAVIIFGVGIWTGATISTINADAYREAAVSNAVATALEARQPLGCKDNEILRAIKGMAENGVHVTGYNLWLETGEGK